MITRLVKMHFKPEETESFIELFESVKTKISSMEGCKGVDLMRDVNNKDIFFTYSIWDSTDHLDQYRNSELFGTTWKATKAKFAHSAEAWSVEQLVGTLNNILK